MDPDPTASEPPAAREKPARARPARPAVPTLDSVASLDADGHRRVIYPADVRGPLTRWRWVIFAVLLGVMLGLPWLTIGGHPAVLLDVPRRQFFLLGQAFNDQDAFLLFFLFSGLGFALLVTAAVAGRLWCGFACPQTVFVEGLYRRIERLIEGPAETRRRLAASAPTPAVLARRFVKHALYIALSLLLAHVVLGYFTPIRELIALIAAGPRQSPEAFAWTMGIALLLYVDGAFFREQFCVIMCPYGRLQSMLTDEDTLVVGYDEKRGEPRGKVKLKVLGQGDCVDCRRCVAVCPTGIDIRQGLQLDCIGCGACADACDEIMEKVQRPAGLIRLDSARGFAGQPRRTWRPRLGVYAVAAAVGLGVALFALHSRGSFEASLLRASTTPYIVEGDELRNAMRVRLASKLPGEATFTVTPVDRPGQSILVTRPEVSLPTLGAIEIPVVITTPLARYRGPEPVELRVRQGNDERTVRATLLGPAPRAP